MTDVPARPEPDSPVESAAARPAKAPGVNRARAFWLKQLHSWHWISAGVSLMALLLFAVTGITLNHAPQIKSEPRTTEQSAVLPAPLVERLSEMGEETTDPVPDAVARWAQGELKARIAGRPTETTPDEVYVALPRPGGDGWMTIDRVSGDVTLEVTKQGWVAYLNDLHKGRNTGKVWYWFIDVLAVACVVFALTGLGLLWLHGRSRPSTWPLVGLGLLIPVIIALLFIH